MLSGADSDLAWKQIGRVEPYFGVLTGLQYRRDCLTERTLAQFFQSGDEHVAVLLADLRSHFEPTFQPGRVLDFGCGVGRLTVALGKVAEEVVALDVSEGMLAEARANCTRLGLGNVQLARSDDALTQVDGSFQLIHSYLVFQHIPVRRGEQILTQLLQRLEPGGLLAVQVVIARACPAYRKALTWIKTHVPLVNAVCNLAQGQPWSWPMMQMNLYELSRLLRLLHVYGCSQCFTRLGQDGQYTYAFLMAQKQK